MAARQLARSMAAPLRASRMVSAPLLRPALVSHQRRNYADAHHGLPRDEVKHRVLDILHTFDKADAQKVNENAHFVNDLGLDSLDVVEVVMSIEEEFALEIPDEAADRIMSVPDAISYVASQPEGAYKLT